MYRERKQCIRRFQYGNHPQEKEKLRLKGGEKISIWRPPSRKGKTKNERERERRKYIPTYPKEKRRKDDSKKYEISCTGWPGQGHGHKLTWLVTSGWDIKWDYVMGSPRRIYHVQLDHTRTKSTKHFNYRIWTYCNKTKPYS